MEAYILKGANMATRETAHEELMRGLKLPAHYGKNLDALWDAASTMHAEVVLQNPAHMLNGLGIYGCKLLQTLFEAVEENPRFCFRLEE